MQFSFNKNIYLRGRHLKVAPTQIDIDVIAVVIFYKILKTWSEIGSIELTVEVKKI